MSKDKTIEHVQQKLDLMFRLLTTPTRGWSIDEAADIVGISRASIYREVADGKLATIQRRGSTRIEHSELVRWNNGKDPLAEIIPLLGELMAHIQCPLAKHPTCPLKSFLRRPDTA